MELPCRYFYESSESLNAIQSAKALIQEGIQQNLLYKKTLRQTLARKLLSLKRRISASLHKRLENRYRQLLSEERDCLRREFETYQIEERNKSLDRALAIARIILRGELEVNHTHLAKEIIATLGEVPLSNFDQIKVNHAAREAISEQLPPALKESIRSSAEIAPGEAVISYPSGEIKISFTEALDDFASNTNQLISPKE